MNITDELIKKYFQRQCTEEEQAVVNDYFIEHPEVMDKYLDETDFVNSTSDQRLDPALSKEMLDNIEYLVLEKKARKRSRVITLYAAAAACILIGFSVFFWTKPWLQSGGYQNMVSVKGKLSIDTVVNLTSNMHVLHLPDGSVITLAPKSQVIYQHAFAQKHRDIYLSGEAVFEVAKDQSRPFTVFAGRLSTTALGTRFRVIAKKNQAVATVALYSGKVSVKKYTGDDISAVDQEIILSPGQAFVWKRGDERGKKIHIPETIESFSSRAHDLSKIYWLNDHTVKFEEYPLADVLVEMQKAYHIRINIKKARLERKYFTGVIDTRKTSSDKTLQTIAMLNQLGIEKQNGVFILSNK